MRFKITLRPSDVELLPEPMRSEVRKQVPEQVARERHRIDLAMARLAEWDAENRRWQDYALSVVTNESARAAEDGDNYLPMTIPGREHSKRRKVSQNMLGR